MSLDFDVMRDIISLSELKDNPNAVIDEVEKGHTAKIITRRGKPTAVIVNLEDFVKLKAALEEAEAREISRLHQEFVSSQLGDEIGTSEELWTHFGLKIPASSRRETLSSNENSPTRKTL